jgi:predicted unusual protein kinase regulating ubiquinone biosynthesis (AarF/ABC1/UbiB family)
MMRRGRLGRLGRLGGMATGLVADAAGAGASRLTESADRAADRLHRKAAERMFRVFAEMKGLPLKAGQMLSYIDEFIPPEHRHIYEETLGRLQMDTPPMPWDEVVAVFDGDFGRAPEAVFASFDRAPIAAASIGQVYGATTHEGQEVVVKVQYPGVVDALRSDIANAGTLVTAMSAVMPGMDFHKLVDQITHSLLDECDYAAELSHQLAFREAWAGDPGVHVPAPLPELCTGRVLVAERVRAEPWREMLDRATHEEKSAYGCTIFRFVFGSLFEHGMFNGDPHPGNYLFHPDGRVSFIDYGCVMRYGPAQRDGFRALRELVLARRSDGAFREVARRALSMPDDLDPEVMDAMMAYLHQVFEPVTEPQPYRWTRAYSTEMLRHTQALKMSMMKKLLRGRKAYPLDVQKADGNIAFLGRIVFGLGSILATLETEGDFHAMVARMR